jgi:NADH-quinone oxidoreductase subunit K
MIHLAGPALLAAVLAGAGVYGMLARRNVVLVLVGAELLLAAAGVLLVMAAAMPATGLHTLAETSAAVGPAAVADTPIGATDPLLTGQVATIMLITIAAAEVGLALAIVLALFRTRATSDVTAVRELGEAHR